MDHALVAFKMNFVDELITFKMNFFRETQTHTQKEKLLIMLINLFYITKLKRYSILVDGDTFLYHAIIGKLSEEMCKDEKKIIRIS